MSKLLSTMYKNYKLTQYLKIKMSTHQTPYSGEKHEAYLAGIQIALFAIHLAELWNMPDDGWQRYLDLMEDLQDKISESPYLNGEKTAYQTGIRIAMLKLGRLYDPDEILPIYDQIAPGMKIRQGDTTVTVVSIMPPGPYTERMPDGSTTTTRYSTERVTLQYASCAETPEQARKNQIIAMPRHEAIKLLQEL